MSFNEIIVAKNISKSFIGVKALQNINITIRPGEIHCLAGENGCGKSTLVKCISGVNTPDSGEIIINGKSYSSLSTVEAMKEGIQVIYQDLSLFDHMTVAENIALSKLKFENDKFISWKKIQKIAQEQLDKIGVTMDLDMLVSEISMANKQMVAICRALAQNAKVLFMDEPTTALTNTEVKNLMRVMTELKNKGLAIVFISHKLDEVFEVSDIITIFRNGEKIGDFVSSLLDQKTLSYLMTGRTVDYTKYHREYKDNSCILKLKNLSKKNQYENINLIVRPGDIIGITGLLGSGRTELALSLFGLNRPDNGVIEVDGKEVKINSPMSAKNHGIALLPEDRSTQGLFIEKMIKENISSACVEKISSNKLLDRSKEEQLASNQVGSLRVRTPSIDTVVGTLSGGNQQKVAISKWICTKPKIFIMDTPTVGIDIGSKAEIYEQIQSFARKGMGIILISDEIPEILANCNRVIVMANGKFIKEFDELQLHHSSIAKQINKLIGNQVEA